MGAMALFLLLAISQITAFLFELSFYMVLSPFESLFMLPFLLGDSLP